GTWTTRDEIVFAPEPFGPLFRVPAAGGVPEAVTSTADEKESHRLPHALPDGRHVLFTSGYSKGEGVRLLDLDTRAVTAVLDDPRDARFVSRGQAGELLFARHGNLMAQTFDPLLGRLAGQPRIVAEHVLFRTERFTGPYSFSTEGSLVYQPVPQSHLEWFDL